MSPNAMISQLRALKISARELRSLTSSQKNQVLLRAARLLIERQSEILQANQKDIRALKKAKGRKDAVSPAFIDRLTLNPERLASIQESLRQVAEFPDPVGEEVEKKQLKNGLHVSRVRSPLGVILMIFESRPNVAIEAFSLAFKAGNAVILRGGKESSHTTRALYQILNEALRLEGVLEKCLWGIHNPDRKIPQFLLKQKKWIDVVVPRGGDGLIEFVSKNSEIPIIKNDRGMCHVYVHEDANFEMAKSIVKNAKTQRPGVCNAMETLLVNEKIASHFLPELFDELKPHSVKWHVCPKSKKILAGRTSVQLAKKKNWDTEYLDLEINCRVVSSLDAAISHIEEHGSRHSECILTQSSLTAEKFQKEVDAAVVYWNASTRFTDGFELGLGGELGISTQKLHVRGPVGLKELTSVRWVIQGSGQIRN
jgi:glutamate-5-semialdehyde dehydrogenase